MTARNRNTLAELLEELNFAYTDVYTGKAQTGEINAQVNLNEVYSKLSTVIKSHIYTVDGTSTISLVNSSQSSITLLNDAEAIGSTGTAGQNTVTVEINEERESTSYYLESDGMYYPMCIRNYKVELDEENATTTQPTGAGSLGSGIEILFIDDGENEEKSESNFIIASKNGTTITLTAKSNTNGTTRVVVRDGDVSLTGNIEVTVNPTYTISLGTMTNGSVSITTNNIDTTSNTKYGKDVEIELTATGNQGYEFEKWNDESTINPKEIKVGSTTTGTYTATFKEKPKPYGAQVELNGGNAITVKTVGTTNYTIEDNWKLFYIDDAADGYVHLIYGDYYPADVQTDPDTGSTNTINLTPSQSYQWGVNSEYPRLNLLKYLKNNAGYSSEATNLDNSTSAGSYESWTDLATALTESGKALNGKTIRVQGAPNITMWKESWKEQGYTELVLQNATNGYKIEKKVSSGTQSYSEYVSVSDEPGYNDTLYFPYKGNTALYGPNATKVSGYWLASPGGSDSYYACFVESKGGIVGCYGLYTRNNLSARPVVSILKSDFQNIPVFSGISITK